MECQTVINKEIRQRYRKKPHLFVTAVQINLETDGLVYQKWGSEQRCNKGDWIVDNDGDVYTVECQSFERTYRKLSPGVYLKTTPIWATMMTTPGVINTKEGKTNYKAGDYVVANNEDGTDAYSISSDKFNLMYELDSTPEQEKPTCK